jgi:hypothetical protein
MRSKWLDWPSVPEIMEKGRGSEPTKPSKPGSVGFVGTVPLDSSIAQSPRSVTRLPVSDPYAERLRAAFRQINAPSYLAGMVPWLHTARPDLYAELTARLPDEIQRLWSERAPLEQFESVLAQLISVHHQCCELHRARSSR